MLSSLTAGLPTGDYEMGHGLPLGNKVSERKLRLWVEACRNLSGRDEDRPWGSYDLETESGLRAACERWSVVEHPSVLPSNPLPVRAALLREIVGSPFRPLPYRWDDGRLCEVSHAHHGMSLSYTEYLDPVAWLTSLVRSLAESAYSERAEDGTLDAARLAVLSDALEEAGCVRRACLVCAVAAARGGPGKVRCGCVESDLLAHLRSPGPHVRGCWAIDVLTGRQ